MFVGINKTTNHSSNRLSNLYLIYLLRQPRFIIEKDCLRCPKLVLLKYEGNSLHFVCDISATIDPLQNLVIVRSATRAGATNNNSIVDAWGGAPLQASVWQVWQNSRSRDFSWLQTSKVSALGIVQLRTTTSRPYSERKKCFYDYDAVTK